MSVKLVLTISDGRFRNFYTQFDSNYERLLLENGRYWHAPIRSNTSTPCASVPVTFIIIPGGRENAAILCNGWHIPSKAQHADH